MRSYATLRLKPYALFLRNNTNPINKLPTLSKPRICHLGRRSGDKEPRRPPRLLTANVEEKPLRYVAPRKLTIRLECIKAFMMLGAISSPSAS